MGGIGAVQGLSIIENGFIEKFGFGTGRAFPVDSIIGMRAAAKAAKDGKNRNKDQRTCKNGLDAALGGDGLSFLQLMPKIDDESGEKKDADKTREKLIFLYGRVPNGMLIIFHAVKEHDVVRFLEMA